MVNWDECDRNKILVCYDHLYIFFALKYFPDNYTSCRLWEKPRSEWKYYYGRGYDPLANHPDTALPFASVTIPFWEETLQLARDVQRHFASFNRFIGMDIGVSEDGPVVIDLNNIFGSGLFESVAGPMLKDDEVRRCLLEYGMVTHNKFR